MLGCPQTGRPPPSLPFLFHQVRHLSCFHSGIVMLAGQVTDACATPVAGLFSDQSEVRTCWQGRESVPYLSIALWLPSSPGCLSPIHPHIDPHTTTVDRGGNQRDG